MLGVRKAVFPVAGLGTHFLPARKAGPKQMHGPLAVIAEQPAPRAAPSNPDSRDWPAERAHGAHPDG
jgi:hypothetical protein